MSVWRVGLADGSGDALLSGPVFPPSYGTCDCNPAASFQRHASAPVLLNHREPQPPQPPPPTTPPPQPKTPPQQPVASKPPKRTLLSLAVGRQHQLLEVDEIARKGIDEARADYAESA
ncbi:hypothetical protein BOX15_Mlig021300g1 [Macrostomum lignano]|uniref:Uncharacterized protein n=1 Tax=Macrostomum lignano TaxID=282301 RepID=A0A267GMW2_9PLAT|nr:hypothetical protein BOX15_Mlig021300g1 [Macrostomum lignano]